MLLAIESATRDGSVALFGGDGLLEERVLGAHDHARTLAPAVRDLVGDRWESLTGYAISAGPGSFTGLRIGLALLKGLAFVHPRPLVTVSTLEVIAAGAGELARPTWPVSGEVNSPAGPSLASGSLRGLRPCGGVLAVLDARRGEVFAALFAGGLPHGALTEGTYLSRDLPRRLAGVDGLVAAGDVHALGGDGPWELLRGTGPRASVLARLAWPRLLGGEGADALLMVPSYGEPCAAEARSVEDPTGGSVDSRAGDT